MSKGAHGMVRSSIHMLGRLGSGFGDVVGSDGERVLGILSKLRLGLQDRASGADGEADSNGGAKRKGGHHQGVHHLHIGAMGRRSSKPPTSHDAGASASYTEEDVDALLDWVQDAMAELSSRSKTQREEVKMRSQFSKILDASTQEYMLAMFTSNQGDTETRTGHADSHTDDAEHQLSSSAEGGSRSAMDDAEVAEGRWLSSSGAVSAREALVRGESNMRVVSSFILCSPTATSVQTTKGEHLMGRTRVVSG